jgi:hypothetical protein
MIATNASPLLSEKEIEEWFVHTSNSPPPEPVGDLSRRIEGHLDDEGFVLFGDFKDFVLGPLMIEIEDEMLFLVGTLCLLNGQRAVWSAIYDAFHAASGGTSQDEFEFLERQTAKARADKLLTSLPCDIGLAERARPASTTRAALAGTELPVPAAQQAGLRHCEEIRS